MVMGMTIGVSASVREYVYGCESPRGGVWQGVHAGPWW